MALIKRRADALLKPAQAVKLSINVGCLLDIPTGKYYRGIHGESILNGGLAHFTGMAGKPNNFKSTIMHYEVAVAQYRIATSFINSYDSEMTMNEQRLIDVANNVRRLHWDSPTDVVLEGEWSKTDKSVYNGNKWFDTVRTHCKDKVEKSNDWLVKTPFVDRDGKPLMSLLPTFQQCDSLSDLSTDGVERMQDNAEIGESGQNTVAMKLSQHKTQMLMELPALAAGSNTYFYVTAHVGDVIQIDPGKPVAKVLADLPQGTKLKNVPNKFLYQPNTLWYAKNTKTLINQGTKEPEFPRDENDDKRGDTDLRLISLSNIRNKEGITGFELQIIVSQTLGVLPSLTEFYYLKESNRFGLIGSVQNYAFCLLPDVKMTRKTVRQVLNTNRRAQRAANILAELCQMQEYWFHLEKVMIKPEELYEKVAMAGYDWDMILSKTRGWWALEEDDRPIGLFLSTMDLIHMANGSYHPYWLEEDKKTIKAEYKHLVPVLGGF